MFKILIFLLGLSSVTSSKKQFSIYWNVPTDMCKQYNVSFEIVHEKFGVIQNEGDTFRGNKIVILYDPGYFPAILEDAQGNRLLRNGGVPQEGNVTEHLEHFSCHVEEQIPNSNFSGLGVIDFESWRPIFRQLWGAQKIYRNYTIDLEREKHPNWIRQGINKEAENRFERAGRIFMEETLNLVKQLRPKALWGYYAFPYCYNWRLNQQSAQCHPDAVVENDRSMWLFDNEEVYLPAVYMPIALNETQKIGFVSGRVDEAIRLANKSAHVKPVKVIVYYSYVYEDQRDTFLNKSDLIATITSIANAGADGIVVWGSSNDFKSENMCWRFKIFLEETLGPVLRDAQK